MIDVGKYKEILDQGLLLDHYVLLCNLRDGTELVSNKRIQGFINLMHKKGYIEEGVLTEKALTLLDNEVHTVVPVVIPKTIRVGRIKTEEPNFDYANWVIELHRKCEAKIMEKTGKKQIRDKIEGKGYSFLPNSTDLGRVILRAVNMYKINDFEKIEKTILKYIDRCAKAGKWFPILGYYIMKNSMSPMVTDMDSEEEEGTDSASIHIV